MSDHEERLRDAAYATTIPDGWDHAVAGYYGGPLALHVWPKADWERFRRNKKLPVWVAGYSGATEGGEALAALRALGVPEGVWTAVDMESRKDKSYLTKFGQTLEEAVATHAEWLTSFHDSVGAHYRVWPYGSASTIFGNPALDGFWVADYKGIGPYMYKAPDGAEVRATQYQGGPGYDYDSSTVATFTFHERERWWI